MCRVRLCCFMPRLYTELNRVSARWNTLGTALDWLKKYNMCGSHPLWVSLRRVDPLQLYIAHPKQLYAVAPRHKSNNAFTAWYTLDQLSASSVTYDSLVLACLIENILIEYKIHRATCTGQLRVLHCTDDAQQG